MTNPKWTIAFDADDTLWHNERDFAAAFAKLSDVLAEHIAPDDLQQRLLETEQRNLSIFGFGVKGYTLSAIETAVEVSGGAVSADQIAQILTFGHEMLRQPVEVFDGVRDVVSDLKQRADVIVITKGDLIDQERKLAQSGLADLFDGVEIVSDKTAETYAHIFARHDTAHQMMVGNSLKSDVIPALQAGVWGVHVPCEHTWDYERAEPPVAHRHFRQISSLHALPDLIATLSG